MSTVLANIKSATHAVIDGFNAGDVDAIMAPRAPNCTFNILPKSMNRPANGNEEYRAFITRLLPVLKNFTVSPQPAPSIPILFIPTVATEENLRRDLKLMI